MEYFIWLIFNFILYSYIGWLIEVLYCYYKTGSFKKGGFLKSPLKPMYGFAMTILVSFKRFINPNIFIMMILGFIIPTSIEYISGYLLKKLFNKTYWDYSDLKYNISGLISLVFSFYWIFLCLFGVYYFQPIVEKVYIKFYTCFEILSPILLIFIVLDFLLTIKSLTSTRVIE